jgi:DNA-binding transcriptional ArsR family regulator
MKEAAELFKLLSVDTRIEIVELLKRGPMTVNALAEALGVTQSAVSQHLRVLRSAGLVENERKGYWIHYSLNREALERCRERLNRVCTCGCVGDPPGAAKGSG